LTGPPITDITKLALEEDFKWKSSEGFIVVWSMVPTTGFQAGKRVAYVWGYGPCKKYAGWTSVQHAAIFPTYSAAAAQLPAIMDHDTHWNYTETDVRVVQVQVRPPVVILADMPANILQVMAEL